MGKMEINRAALLEWVQELETTDKPQAKGYLNIPGVGFCCLGVMCELFADRLKLTSVAEPVTDVGGATEAVRYFQDGVEYGTRALLPNSVANYIGCEEDIPLVQITYQ